MNAVEIEEAVSALADAPFDPAEFPYAFLAAFGNKENTVKRLRAAGKASTNKSDLPGGVLQRSNIHLAVAEPGTVGDTLKQLLASPATAKHKCKFALATDGRTVEAENLADGETLACDYADLGDHFGFLLALAGITTVRAIRENAFDVKATGRLNKLYVELLRHNTGWDGPAQREALNHFFARLIFCFFAEDTGIFLGDGGLFTHTVQQMTDPDGANTHAVLSEVFRAMDTPVADRPAAALRPWANTFPYVNGGLFAGAGGGIDVPAFSKIARSYLLHVGALDWTKINPDIFGSMIQAVADDAERGALGLHYTSVPNILKVLNPLFLDDLRRQLDGAGDGSDAGSRRKLLNLRRRLSRLRVFDPACGSGNFLVIAYKQMRQIEAEANARRGEPDRRSDIPPTNFRGIELRHFAAEVARLALVIAEYQCDVLHRGERLALAEFLPLDSRNWITCGNALRLDWLSVCPPVGKGVKLQGDDLFNTPLDQTEMEFENEGSETYICGNPPYLGTSWQSAQQKEDLRGVFEGRTSVWRSLDYVAGWFMKAADYGTSTKSASAFVSTNSICQGQQVPILWPLIYATEHRVHFAHTSFKWANLASHNAGVTVVIVGIARHDPSASVIYSTSDDGASEAKSVAHINAYIVAGSDLTVTKMVDPFNGLPAMDRGDSPVDGGGLLMNFGEAHRFRELESDLADRLLKRFYGSEEIVRGSPRFCIWIETDAVALVNGSQMISPRLEQVSHMRSRSVKLQTRALAGAPHRFGEIRRRPNRSIIAVPGVSSENRNFLPVDLVGENCIVSNLAFALYDAPLWNLALIASVCTWCGWRRCAAS